MSKRTKASIVVIKGCGKYTDVVLVSQAEEANSHPRTNMLAVRIVLATVRCLACAGPVPFPIHALCLHPWLQRTQGRPM